MKRSDALIENLGQLIRGWREERGFTQAQMAKQCGLSANHFGEVERGEVEASLSTLDCLARGFRMSLPELLAPVAEMPGDPQHSMLSLWDWIRVQELLGKLKQHADGMVTQARQSAPQRVGSPDYRRHPRKRTRRKKPT